MDELEINNIVISKEGKKIVDFQNQQIVIKARDKVAVIGENGAGKTTLINAIINDRDITHGEINLAVSKSQLGIVFQNNAYSNLIKVKELIKLVYPHWDKPKYLHFLEEYQLTKLQNRLVEKLSNGEQQRLTLGLVLEQRKPLYLLDEITSGLDAVKRNSLLEVLKEKTAGATVLYISHYFEEIDGWADKFLIMSMGKLLFFGSREELMKRFFHYAMVATSQTILLNHPLPAKVKPPFKLGARAVWFVNGEKELTRLQHHLAESKIKATVEEQDVATCYYCAMKEQSENE